MFSGIFLPFPRKSKSYWPGKHFQSNVTTACVKSVIVSGFSQNINIPLSSKWNPELDPIKGLGTSLLCALIPSF